MIIATLLNPQSPEAAGWLWIAAVAIFVGLSALVGLILGVWTLIERIKGRGKPEPQEIKQPIQIEHVERFVTHDHFTREIGDKFGRVDARFLGIEQQIKEQVHKTDTYLHEMRHARAGELQAVLSAGEERHQVLSAKLDAHWKDLSQERSVSTARLHEKVEASNAALRAEIDVKVSAVHEKIDAVPEKIVRLLKDTGAIGKGGRA